MRNWATSKSMCFSGMQFIHKQFMFSLTTNLLHGGHKVWDGVRHARSDTRSGCGGESWTRWDVGWDGCDKSEVRGICFSLNTNHSKTNLLHSEAKQVIADGMGGDMRGWTHGVEVTGSHRGDGMGVTDPIGGSRCFSLNTHHLKTNLLHHDTKLGNIEEYVFLWNAISAQAAHVLYLVHLRFFVFCLCEAFHIVAVVRSQCRLLASAPYRWSRRATCMCVLATYSSCAHACCIA